MIARRPIAAVLVLAMAMATCVLASGRGFQEHRNDDVRSTSSSGRGHSDRLRKAAGVHAGVAISPTGPCDPPADPIELARREPPTAIERAAAPVHAPPTPSPLRPRSRAPPAV